MVWLLAAVGIIGVFCGLLILCIFLLFVQKIAVIEWKSFRKKDNNSTVPKIQHDRVSGEIAAALAVSIYLNNRSYRKQKELLTIHKVTKPFSPWVNSGKIKMITDCNEVYNRRR